jgi:hypothetical protein
LAYAATLNFTDDGPLTRETDWSLLPFQTGRNGATKTESMKMPALKTVTRDEPCDYLANDLERYYPVKTCDGRYQAVYARYKALTEATLGMSFIGRCGTYQYLDTHQVVNQSLAHARRGCAGLQRLGRPWRWRKEVRRGFANRIGAAAWSAKRGAAGAVTSPSRISDRSFGPSPSIRAVHRLTRFPRLHCSVSFAPSPLPRLHCRVSGC